MPLDEPRNFEPDQIYPPFEVFDLVATSGCPVYVDDAAVDWVFRAAHFLLTQPCDHAIMQILEMVASESGADRACLFTFDETGERFCYSHDWYPEPVSPFMIPVYDVSISLVEWLYQFLIRHYAVMINQVDAMPSVASELRAAMLEGNAKSVLSVPFFLNGKLHGSITLMTVCDQHRWGPETAIQLSLCAALIAVARLERQPAKNILAAANAVLDVPVSVHLRQHHHIHNVPINRISGIRSSRDNSVVYLQDGSVYNDVRRISTWAELLTTANFIRIHRTALINLDHLDRLDRAAGLSAQRWEVHLHGVERPWGVSRSYRRELRQRIGA